MPNELSVIESGLKMVEPQLHRALGGAMPTPRLMQLVLTACERSNKLMAAAPQSILNCAITAATLGLEPDGMTGQFFLLPFEMKGRMIAQSCIGYRGYNTLAARKGCEMTITGEPVHEGDEFSYRLGTDAFLHHKPALTGRGRLIAAWAIAASLNRPPIISVLSLDQIMAVKAKSPGARARGTGEAFSPWNDETVGFPAMASKTAKRRLSRCTPMITAAPQFMMAARMEEAHDEQGASSWIEPDKGVVIDGNATPLPTRHTDQPTTIELISPQPRSSPAAATAPASPDAGAFSSPPPSDAAEPAASASASRTAPATEAAGAPSAEEYERRWDGIIQAATSSVMLRSTWDGQQATRDAINWPSEEDRKRVTRKVSAALKFLEKCEAEKREAEVDAVREGE